MKKDIIVYYYADPDKLTNDHIGNFFDMREFSQRSFPTEGKALAFLDECTRPYSSFSDIITSNSSIDEADYILKHKRLGYEVYEDVFNNLIN